MPVYVDEWLAGCGDPELTDKIEVGGSVKISNGRERFWVGVTEYDSVTKQIVGTICNKLLHRSAGSETYDLGSTIACELRHVLIALPASAGKTPEERLILAASGGHLTEVDNFILQALNDKVLDLDYSCPRIGVTALGVASIKGHVRVVEALLRAGCVPDKRMRGLKAGFEDVEMSPLCSAVLEQHGEIVELLLKAGADVRTDPAALVAAVSKGSVPLVLRMLGAGADIDAMEATGFTPLLMAAKCGSTEIVELLLSRGANVDKADTDGVTPLCLATGYDRPEIVKALLAHGADPNLGGNEEEYPLMIGVVFALPRIVTQLLAAGACWDAAAWGPAQKAVGVAISQRRRHPKQAKRDGYAVRVMLRAAGFKQ
jgi:ankyrin repeat protein